jgi:hypothetical protein
MNHQHHAEALEAALKSGKIPQRSQKFARSLLDGFHAWGRFTEKQAACVESLLTQGQPKANPFTSDVDASALVEMFQQAEATGLQYPKLTLTEPEWGRPLLLTWSKGVVWLSDDASWSSRKQYGRIVDGRKLFMRDTATATMRKFIARVIANPVDMVKQYGHATGNCSFCSRPLDDSTSVALGYGPSCAKRYGLPWSVKATKGEAAEKGHARPASVTEKITGEMVSKGPCTACNSSDAKVTFTTGSAHCFSCGAATWSEEV